MPFNMRLGLCRYFTLKLHWGCLKHRAAHYGQIKDGYTRQSLVLYFVWPPDAITKMYIAVESCISVEVSKHWIYLFIWRKNRFCESCVILPLIDFCVFKWTTFDLEEQVLTCHLCMCKNIFLFLLVILSLICPHKWILTRWLNAIKRSFYSSFLHQPCGSL